MFTDACMCIYLIVYRCLQDYRQMNEQMDGWLVGGSGCGGNSPWSFIVVCTINHTNQTHNLMHLSYRPSHMELEFKRTSIMMKLPIPMLSQLTLQPITAIMMMMLIVLTMTVILCRCYCHYLQAHLHLHTHTCSHICTKYPITFIHSLSVFH